MEVSRNDFHPIFVEIEKDWQCTHIFAPGQFNNPRNLIDLGQPKWLQMVSFKWAIDNGFDGIKKIKGSWISGLFTCNPNNPLKTPLITSDLTMHCKVSMTSTISIATLDLCFFGSAHCS